MTAASRRKGSRVEREVVALFREHGLDAERVPLSGAQGGSFTDDVEVRLGGRKLRAEVKARKSGKGFVQLESWLGNADLLVLKRDRAPPMALLPLPLLIELLAVREQGMTP